MSCLESESDEDTRNDAESGPAQFIAIQFSLNTVKGRCAAVRILH